jgi:predicted anti-sigma-YlaC factor YlaD
VTTDEIVCREFAELTTEYLDAALPPETLELVEEHLVICGWCRDHLHQVVLTAAAIRRTASAEPAPAAAPPPGTVSTLVAALRGRAGGGPP